MRLTDVVNGHWAIQRDMLDEIQVVYATHVRGEKIDIRGVEERLGRSLKNERKYLTVDNGIGRLSVHGVMAKRANLFMDISGGVSTQIIADEFKQALADPAVHTILLDIDSPGGTVDGTADLAELVRASRGVKPIIAFTDGMIASAAYWVASAADRIYISNDTTTVGSIGVISRHLDYSKQLDAMGIKATEITAGKYKAVGSPYKPLSDDDKAVIQERLDYLYTAFVDAVAANRGISIDDKDDWAEGRIFTGTQALKAGLVDGVSTYDGLVKAIASGELANTARASSSDAVPAAGGVPAEPQERGDETMTIEKLKAEHPDLYEAVFQAGASSVDVKALEEKARAAETARVKEVLEQSIPGFEKLVLTLAVDGKSTGGDAAKAIMAKQKDQMAAHRADIADEAARVKVPEAETAGLGEGKPDLSAMSVEERAEAIWAKDAATREEFGNNKASFIAYYKAEQNGQVKQLKTKKEDK